MKRRNERKRRIAYMHRIARICNELRLMVATYRKLINKSEVAVHVQYLAKYDEFDVTTVFKDSSGSIEGWRNEGFDLYEATNPNLFGRYSVELN